jgi:hypothetical protein
MGVEPIGGVAGRAVVVRAIAPSMLPNVCPRQGRRRYTPRFCAAGAGGITTLKTCVRTAAKLRSTTRTCRRCIAAMVDLPSVDTAGNIYSVPLYIGTLFFSCCSSITEPQAASWASRSNTCDPQRAVPQVAPWVPRSSTCDAQWAEPRRQPEPIPGITDVPLHHNRPAFVLFGACLRRQQVEEHYRGPGFMCPMCVSVR